MVWEVEVTDEFLEWWHELSHNQQESVTDRVDLLAERGPDLGRPVVERIHSSRHHNMKELRAAQGGRASGPVHVRSSQAGDLARGWQQEWCMGAVVSRSDTSGRQAV